MSQVSSSATPVRWGARAVTVSVGVYLLVYYFLSHNGGRPTAFAPWLAIPAEVYYHYNLLLHAPSVALAWVAAAGFAHLSATALGGRGSFEQTLGTLGLGIGVASWTTGLHDVVTTFAGYVGVLDQPAYEDAMSTPGAWPHALIWTLMCLYLLAFGWLFWHAMVAAHGLTKSRAALAAGVGLLVYQAVFVLFNR